jgi:hypothetical protein
VLIVDVANVVGSRPTGWWKDRAGAARTFTERVCQAVASGAVTAPVALVVEGQARGGVAAGDAADGIRVVHAAHSGDDAIAELAAEHGAVATVVTADRGLVARVRQSGAQVVGPNWLLTRLPE